MKNMEFRLGRGSKRYWVLALVGALAVGCGSEGGSNDDSGKPSSQTPASSDCAGAFAQTEAPYTANNAFNEFGGFLADEKGFVFTAIPDDTLTDHSAAYPTLLMAGDLQGNLKTIYSADTVMLSNFVMDDENVYVSVLFGGSELIKIPRSGGPATVLVERSVRSAPMTDGKRLYYAGLTAKGKHAVYAIDKTGGTPTLITERGDKYLFAEALEGDSLYVFDADSFDSETDKSLYRISVSTGTSELIAKVPSDAAGQLSVASGVVYSTLISGLQVATYRIQAGREPELMAGGGLPFVIDGESTYYPARTGGITKNTLAFDDPTPVPAAAGKRIYSMAAGPNDLFFSELTCIYRTTK